MPPTVQYKGKIFTHHSFQAIESGRLTKDTFHSCRTEDDSSPEAPELHSTDVESRNKALRLLVSPHVSGMHYSNAKPLLHTSTFGPLGQRAGLEYKYSVARFVSEDICLFSHTSARESIRAHITSMKAYLRIFDGYGDFRGRLRNT